MRYTVTGASPGVGSAAWIAGAWSITPTTGATLNLGNQAAANDQQSYLDVQLSPTRALGDALDRRDASTATS